MLKEIHILKPTNYLHNLNLMKFADLVITDSGGMQEELSYLGSPFIVLRINTEKPITLNNKNSFLCYKINKENLSYRINKILSKRESTKIKF